VYGRGVRTINRLVTVEQLVGQKDTCITIFFSVFSTFMFFWIWDVLDCVLSFGRI
jgi:hypothetical protein